MTARAFPVSLRAARGITLSLCGVCLLFSALTSGCATSGDLQPGIAAPLPPNDPYLMRQMAQVYVSVASASPTSGGGAEMRLILCPDGRYLRSTHSGAAGAGGATKAWEAATRQAARGTWRIQGNTNEGTLTMVDADSNPTSVRYRRCGRDCIFLDNVRWTIEGAANCSP
jgi:hypothetical protein